VIKRSQVHKGDILFSMIGGNIGNQVEVGEFTEFAIKNVALFKHYKYGLPVPGYLKLLSEFLAMDLQSKAAGGAQPFVSLKYFRNLVFALPPEKEQKIIIKIKDQLIEYCSQLKEEINKKNNISSDYLKSSIREVMEQTKSIELV
jgi:type I restriction enzyme S subunit